jgi:hypothetical protein
MRSCLAKAANLRDCTLMTKTATRKSGPWEAAILAVEVRSFLAATMAFIDKVLPRPASQVY